MKVFVGLLSSTIRRALDGRVAEQGLSLGRITTAVLYLSISKNLSGLQMNVSRLCDLSLGNVITFSDTVVLYHPLFFAL